MIYYEFLDDDGEWKLGCMSTEKALICQMVMGGDKFHFVDESAIEFE